MAIQIEYLADHPEAVPLLAAWHHAEWEDLLPGWTFEQTMDELRTHTGRRQVPTTLIALKHGQVIGSASLLVSDLDGWKHLSPWLASVYVLRERRGEGIGRQLITRAAEEARRLGFLDLFLWTEGQRSFYERAGWGAIAIARLGMVEVTIMRRSLIAWEWLAANPDDLLVTVLPLC